MSLLRGAACALALCLAPFTARAQVSDDVVRVGVLTDLSGPYADFAGPGSVVAARMAAEDHNGGRALGKPIEVVGGDHQNKPDVGAALARRWVDTDRVDMVIDMPNSAVALAVQQVGRERNRIIINTSAATTELTGRQCSPVGFHWVLDSYALTTGITRAVMGQGGRSWYYLTVDYEGGYAQERGSEAVVNAEGGRVMGRARHPLNTADFSSFLLRAQASRAQIVALAKAGTDTVNAIKQAGEFGLTRSGQRLVGFFVNITDIKALGLQTAQGVVSVDAWYWDQNEESRAFARRFAERHQGRMPTQYQAGVYSGVRHWLKAIEAAGTDEAMAVAAKMRELPVDDVFAHGGRVRADGRHVHDVHLVEVKKPEDSSAPWDLYRILSTIPADQAFRPLNEGGCPLVRQ
ncbi:ABC transporter substrate-binding protein [Siccirubricoccus sp. KC 17139]|uniref:ABC transporter substrate-binding protein n=1 Tax=Siccirubricoccus soli TaxID=2899147 RepID=A0ABT1CYY7_9PROT|nr:ABC transporter substrate-binding protein [Siccirubricoccus soli]MCO6414875.1 ABC transporter substrate-binding protein [Siccirubricoccus soli]MCP2681005.1 ABC transporter substrate-binding protein [Siccirubricoccus soli]